MTDARHMAVLDKASHMVGQRTGLIDEHRTALGSHTVDGQILDHTMLTHIDKHWRCRGHIHQFVPLTVKRAIELAIAETDAPNHVIRVKATERNISSHHKIGATKVSRLLRPESQVRQVRQRRYLVRVGFRAGTTRKPMSILARRPGMCRRDEQDYQCQ